MNWLLYQAPICAFDTLVLQCGIVCSVELIWSSTVFFFLGGVFPPKLHPGKRGCLVKYFGCSAGMVGILWFLLWLVVGYSEPATHPRISERERKYIESSIGKTEKVRYCCERLNSHHLSLSLFVLCSFLFHGCI